MTSDMTLARHLSDRLGFGPRPGDLNAIAGMGPEAWIEQQLHPQSLMLPNDLTTRLKEMEALSMSPLQTLRAFGPPAERAINAKDNPEKKKELREQARFIPSQGVEAKLLRGVFSPRQLEEVLADFWFNHFNVYAAKGLDSLWTTSYDESAIRPHVLGRFRDLLGATARHPAMLFYLDNWENTAPGSEGARGNFTGLNENYARELMELHTLGVDGGYSQADVITLARILTGWGFGNRNGETNEDTARGRRRVEGRLSALMDVRRTGGFIFSSDRHDFSKKVFLGHAINGRGEVEGDEALDILASHPSTARHISFKLAQYFLADTPDTRVVETMAETFRSSNGDIRAVLKTLFTHPAFLAPSAFGTKFKTPLRYTISAVRASGVPMRNFRPLFGVLAQLGEAPYGCLTPDGYKCTEDAWLNADAMTRRITFAIALAGGRLPLNMEPTDNSVSMKKPERVADRTARQETANAPAGGSVVDPDALIETLGQQLSDNTRAAIAAARPELRASMILGSPEFMRC